jgi:hypothetical protein
MEPIVFLWLTVLVTALAAGAQWVLVVRRRRALRRLASLWHLHFSADDRFRLARRIVGRLPEIGAADLRARNLLYKSDSGRRWYLFTIEYEIGAIGSQRRKRRVAMFDEPVAQEGETKEADSHFAVAPENLPLIEQYQLLHQRRGSFA